MAERSPDKIDVIVEQVRSKSHDSIIRQCGTMQVLDLTQPLGLNDIYVNVNILETIVGYRRLDITQLVQINQPEQFNRWGLGRVTESRVAGLTAAKKYSKLIVLGKPGSGKTTFLKYLALQCSNGQFQVDKVPIFLTVKNFAEAVHSPTLLVYITQLVQACGIELSEITEILKHGRALILLDGMDEIKEEDNQRVLQHIYEFASQFERNQFVITCRIAAQEYHFDKFTEVENSDFNLQQIGNFASNWFSLVDPVKSERFMHKLQENESIQELANNPLLLTLLCLTFQETAEFPWRRLDLYQEGTNLLLKKWDSNKDVERSQVYKNLSVQQKQDLLSQIAFSTFERNEYFFKQQELEQYIADYISNLACVKAEEVLSDLGVIKSIELQHGLLVERARGIYSFSHLTFQEYFTARQIAICSHPQILETALQKLVSQITEKRWREVFLLTVEMLRNADYLVELMKQKIEQLVAEDWQLQAVISWANQKSRTANAPYKQAAIRAFYITLARTIFMVNSFHGQAVNRANLEVALDLAGDTLELAFSLDNSFALNRFGAIDLIIDGTLVLALARAINLSIDFTLGSELVSVLDLSITLVEPRLKDDGQRSLLCALLKLQQQLPDLKPLTKFEKWWQSNGKAWTEQLRSVMINQRQIGYDWQLDDRQREKLRQYCCANQLLLDCLKSDCYITRSLRSQIEETLLLPVAELGKSES